MAQKNQFFKPINSPYMTPVLINNTLHIESLNRIIVPYDSTYIKAYTLDEALCIITITYPTGKTETINSVEQSKDIKLEYSGLYTIRYEGSISQKQINPPITTDTSLFNIAFYITAAINYETLPKRSIMDVINRVLDLAEPHMVGDTRYPRYKLDPKQAEEFSKIEAPEFAFTKHTLREILDQIGGYIHGMPRLVRGEDGKIDTIRYSMYGGTEKAVLSDPKYPYMYRRYKHNIESYVTQLDSSVDNLVNTLDTGEGAIVEPYSNGLKTVRSEEAYARITEGNMVISTVYPIYSVQKLEVRAPNGKVGDITPYVFEGAEYGRLSSFDGKYPLSKAYGIYYNLGQKNIRGLNFKSPTVIGGAGSKYAIANIIKQATGYDITAKWWQGGNYPQLAFRITYTPVFSARVLQHKPYVEKGAAERTLVYNQGANLVETRYYGENLKGTIMRMGNVDLTQTYRIQTYSLIPKVGQLWGDDYYVSGMVRAQYAQHCVLTVEMSKDFNRLSQFIGINSQWRAYEVSEKQAYDRDMVYSDFAIIGDREQADGIACVTGSGAKDIAQTFVPSTAKRNLTLATVEPEIAHGTVPGVSLPVISSAFGNSLTFGFGMADNYSAGAKSVYNDSGDITGYWQTDVQYTDYYGRLERIYFSLAHEAEITIDNGFMLPQGLYVPPMPISMQPAFVTQPSLRIDKDGGEALHFNYQLQFVTNWRDLIIGSALAHNCPLVTTEKGNGAALYVVKNRIGKFATKIDLASATKIIEYATVGSDPKTEPLFVNDTKIGFNDQTSTVDGDAWAIADKTTGEILIARNVPVNAGQAIKLPIITFTHKLS